MSIHCFLYNTYSMLYVKQVIVLFGLEWYLHSNELICSRIVLSYSNDTIWANATNATM